MSKASYIIVHNLRKSFYKNDSDAFITHLAHAKLAIILNGLNRVLRTFIKPQRFIGNTFRHKHLINGRVEGLNNENKVLKRIAYD